MVDVQVLKPGSCCSPPPQRGWARWRSRALAGGLWRGLFRAGVAGLRGRMGSIASGRLTATLTLLRVGDGLPWLRAWRPGTRRDRASTGSSAARRLLPNRACRVSSTARRLLTNASLESWTTPRASRCGGPGPRGGCASTHRSTADWLLPNAFLEGWMTSRASCRGSLRGPRGGLPRGSHWRHGRGRPLALDNLLLQAAFAHKR
mmetsp:Transcript_64339/g.140047  ORF Transcript_64339/g.140047 Transcript_64339/m.140047 type:complete len:204 (+) Transcript_64339:1195-1806(+)